MTPVKLAVVGGGPSVASMILELLPDNLVVSTVSAHRDHTAWFGMVSLRIIQK